MRLADLPDGWTIDVLINNTPCKQPDKTAVTAYTNYGCRCTRCQTWRRNYERSRR